MEKIAVCLEVGTLYLRWPTYRDLSNPAHCRYLPPWCTMGDTHRASDFLYHHDLFLWLWAVVVKYIAIKVAMVHSMLTKYVSFDKWPKTLVLCGAEIDERLVSSADIFFGTKVNFHCQYGSFLNADSLSKLRRKLHSVSVRNTTLAALSKVQQWTEYWSDLLLLRICV